MKGGIVLLVVLGRTILCVDCDCYGCFKFEISGYSVNLPEKRLGNLFFISMCVHSDDKDGQELEKKEST